MEYPLDVKNEHHKLVQRHLEIKNDIRILKRHTVLRLVLFCGLFLGLTGYNYYLGMDYYYISLVFIPVAVIMHWKFRKRILVEEERLLVNEKDIELIGKKMYDVKDDQRYT